MKKHRKIKELDRIEVIEYFKTLLISYKDFYKKENKKELTNIAIAEETGIPDYELARQKNSDYQQGNKKTCLECIEKFQNHYGVCLDETHNLIFLKDRNELKIKALALKLALNLVDISTEFDDDDNPIQEIINPNYISSEQIKNHKRERFIGIVGAGASNEASYKYMPCAEEASKEIRAIIDKSKLKDLIDEELERLKLLYKLKEDDFETLLFAWSKYDRKSVLGALKKMCEIKHVPHIVYESLAHLLKHRFLDILINFNYDELLDDSLNEELSPQDRKFIYSDGDCPENLEDFQDEMLIGKRLKKPVYIKPHGTISHLNSLRFTREDFYLMPNAIRETISHLLNAEIKDDSFYTRQKFMPINFIVIGFGMESIDLIQIIKKYIENAKEKEEYIPPKFWFFDTKSRLSEFKDIDEDLAELIKDNHECILVKDEKEGKKLGDLLVKLISEIRSCFKPEYKPKGIDRHLLIDEIFKCKDKKDVISRKEKTKGIYLEDRLLFELSISYLECDGILNTTQIVESRAGKYFHLLQKLTNNSITLKEKCEKIGLKNYKGFVWDAYVFSSENENDPVTKEERVEAIVKKFSSVNGFKSRRRRELFIKKKSRFEELLLNLAKNNLLKINAKYIHPHNYLFPDLQPENILNTGLGWVYKYRKFLRKSQEKDFQWDLLLGISEKGRFLPLKIEEKTKLLKNKKVEIILSSYNFEEKNNLFQGLDEYLLSKKPLKLPWWKHNHHLLLFIKIKDQNKKINGKNIELVEGYYYESRMLSRKVNPIRITKENQEDLKVLLKIFTIYWNRAKAHYDEKFTKSINNEKELNELIDEMLGLFKDSNDAK